MDYGALPPEVNSGRMYVGAGSGPMLAAAAAWDGVAIDLYSAAASYSSLIAELTGVWRGPASATMASASAPYTAWLTATAAQAEQTAVQAKAAVGAYEAAFAMTVPPPVIAANRAQLMTLIATNFFGQNLPAIAATEAQYAEMWAQDAAAMYGYARVGRRLSTAHLRSVAADHQPGGPGRSSRRRRPRRRYKCTTQRVHLRASKPQISLDRITECIDYVIRIVQTGGLERLGKNVYQRPWHPILPTGRL
ncbi:hypothetical protein MTIM_53680 [Mycobacterium timonense]|uniref:PPE domain-containing protein n=1 Tax=Mycobacterium timonense TaxID=701043 RepID=A0A7I9ZEP7_9MYCO|nr:hypothetical protein MTIM_53680 [Mycobacterium timonense]